MKVYFGTDRRTDVDLISTRTFVAGTLYMSDASLQTLKQIVFSHIYPSGLISKHEGNNTLNPFALFSVVKKCSLKCSC